MKVMESAEPFTLVISVQLVVAKLIIPRRALGRGLGAVVAHVMVAIPVRIAGLDTGSDEAIPIDDVVV